MATALTSGARAPGQRFRELYDFRYLVRYLVVSSLQTERVTMVFGYLWWLLHPLLLLAIYSVVMDIVLGRGSADGYPYPIFILAAIVPWEFSVRACRNSIIETYTKERQMRQIAFPRSVVPLSTSLAEFVKLLVALALLPFVLLAFGGHLSWIFLLVFPLALLLLLLTLGLAFFLSAINFFFRDIDKLAVHGFRLWFFVSPGLYSVNMVPERFRTWYELNPFAPMLESFRAVLLLHEIPNLTRLGAVAGVSITATLIGLWFFQRCESQFAKLG